MPSVRFSRDKRGYEYVYLMHTPTRRGKPGRAQVLYWYRTPPGVRIGRKPFSEDVQRMLEVQNPGVAFDWPAIINTPVPPPDMTEFWREKRRAAKAAREERRIQEAEEEPPAKGQRSVEQDATPQGGAEAAALESALDATVEPVPEQVETTDETGGDADGPRKRRRRRGGRRRKGGTAQSGDGTGPDENGATADVSGSLGAASAPTIPDGFGANGVEGDSAAPPPDAPGQTEPVS